MTISTFKKHAALFPSFTLYDLISCLVLKHIPSGGLTPLISLYWVNTRWQSHQCTGHFSSQYKRVGVGGWHENTDVYFHSLGYRKENLLRFSDWAMAVYWLRLMRRFTLPNALMGTWRWQSYPECQTNQANLHTCTSTFILHSWFTDCFVFKNIYLQGFSFVFLIEIALFRPFTLWESIYFIALFIDSDHLSMKQLLQGTLLIKPLFLELKNIHLHTRTSVFMFHSTNWLLCF